MAFSAAQTITPSQDMGEKFKWEQGKRYAAGLIPMRRDENGQLQVLLVKRSHLVLKGGSWATPAGGASPRKDRNPLMAAIRESQEELGFAPLGKVNTEPYVLTNPKSSRVFHGYVWLVDESNFTPNLNWENSAAKWTPLSDIKADDPTLMGECAAVLTHLANSVAPAESPATPVTPADAPTK
ncbi:MAG TPA: NUDIX domain-containing protein [Noviherbaspirillum sp.]|nr:NUDIX domain-containing protein [Noviherbaspirillum sp.]